MRNPSKTALKAERGLIHSHFDTDAILEDTGLSIIILRNFIRLLGGDLSKGEIPRAHSDSDQRFPLDWERSPQAGA